MVQQGERLRLALEPRHAFGVRSERVGQNLDRDMAAQCRVRRSVHLPHAAFANLRDDLIGPEPGASSQHALFAK